MFTPQDVLDTLRCEIPEDTLLDMIVIEALSMLDYDDENPEVGMGMSVDEAVDEAVKSIKEDSVRWDKFVYIGEGTKQKALVEVRKRRA